MNTAREIGHELATYTTHHFGQETCVDTFVEATPVRNLIVILKSHGRARKERPERDVSNRVLARIHLERTTYTRGNIYFTWNVRPTLGVIYTSPGTYGLH